MSSVKKWWDRDDTITKRYSSADIQPINGYLQEKFSRGVDYNLKIVIRGDRNVGKSALLSRLKGEQFKEEYIPTNEIQLANIHWNHQNSQSIIKVEVWDVVDKGKPRSISKGLKFFSRLIKGQSGSNINGQAQTKVEPCLDATFINVYKGAHGVIFIMDMTKSSSLSNTTRLIPVQYCESSMKTGLGLMYVYKFLNIPFLCLQRDVLHYQLKRNYNEMISILSELNPKVGNETPKQHYTDPDETKSTNDLPPICSSSSSPFVIEGSVKTKRATTRTNPLNLSDMYDSKTSHIRMKKSENTNKSTEQLEQIPVVLAFSEEIDPADNEIYYLNNNNNLESPTRSYTFAPSSNNDDSDICGVDGDNLYLTNKNSPHEIIMDELQSDLRLGQSNLSYPHHFNRSKLKVDSTIENSDFLLGQLRKPKSRQNNTEEEDDAFDSKSLTNDNGLSISNENIIILPIDNDALEQFLEDS
ncbi:Rab-like protein isoform 3 [Schistosoma japonicum]|uniref:Rab-like protein isoform 3 n=1 Tax=Schistosoma japonicum TaxID=6182 RepID=A0A4Z2DH55_SCHJA|nr:Rab-like protein isoform 3 [Schistosoma japonicum]